MASMEHARGGDGGVATSSSGVQVRKWVATGAAAVPVVKYELASAREEPVAVTLTDAVPPHLDPDDVGFHDDHHGDCWTRPGTDAIQFETTLDADDELTTVYGVRKQSIEDPQAYLDRPTVAVDEPSDGAGGAAGSSASTVSASPDVVDERLQEALDDAAATSGSEGAEGASGSASTASASDDGDVASADDSSPEATLSLSDPSVEADGGDADDGASERVDAGEGSVDGSGSTEASEVGAPTDRASRDAGPVWGGDGPDAVFEDESVTGAAEGDAADEPAAGGSVADAAVSGEGVLADLARELRSEDVDAATKEALARELNLQLSASSSQFVEHLQSRMKEKRGQTAADIERLEDSIAELYGLKADSSVVASVREQTADTERVEALSASLKALSEAKADAEAVAALEAGLSALSEGKADAGAVAALEADLASLEASAATTEDVDEARSSLQDRITALDGAIEDVDERTASEEGVEELAHGVADLDDRTPDQSAFESLRADHETLASDAAMTADLGGVERALEELDESLSAELERVESRLADRVDEEAAARADAVEGVEREVESVAERSATTERVASVEADLERRYVTEADITAALESRLQTTLFARTLLVAAGTGVGAGGALVGTGVTGGVVLVMLGLAGLAYWWWLNESELDVGGDGDADGADDVV
jgi:hypothetical protein